MSSDSQSELEQLNLIQKVGGSSPLTGTIGQTILSAWD